MPLVLWSYGEHPPLDGSALYGGHIVPGPDIVGQILTIIGASGARNFYSYGQTQPEGYPFATAMNADSDAERLSRGRIARTFRFNIRVIQERIEVTASEAERILLNVVDTILAALDDPQNYNLNGTVSFVYPPSVSFGYIQVPDADERVCDINLPVKVIE